MKTRDLISVPSQLKTATFRIGVLLVLFVGSHTVMADPVTVKTSPVKGDPEKLTYTISTGDTVINSFEFPGPKETIPSGNIQPPTGWKFTGDPKSGKYSFTSTAGSKGNLSFMIDFPTYDSSKPKSFQNQNDTTYDITKDGKDVSFSFDTNTYNGIDGNTSGRFGKDAQTPKTPEPQSLALLGSGMLGVGGFFRKRLLPRS